MLKSILLFFVIILMSQAKAQMVEIIIPGSVNNYESKAKIFYRIFFPFKFGVLDVPAGIRGRWGPFGCDTIAACGPRCSTRNAATCRILT
jgi:hypothetical protein